LVTLKPLGREEVKRGRSPRIACDQSWMPCQERRRSSSHSSVGKSSNAAYQYELPADNVPDLNNWGQARSNYYPTLSVGPSYTRSRSSQSQSPTSSLSSANPNSNLFNLPFDVSWEPDLWGRVRNTVHQSSNAAQVSAADLENVKLTEQTNLAVFYFQLRGEDALEELYQETVEVDRQSLELTRALYK
jgi:outer membrane protein TolC